jgi:DNA polymerase-3 subunit beta
MTTATKERRSSRKTAGGTCLTAAELKRALHAVAPAVAARGVKPVLANALLSGETLTATDLELRITTPLAYAGPAVLLPHARLKQIVDLVHKEDPHSTIELRSEQKSCVVSSKRGEWRLPTEDASEFPAAFAGDFKPMLNMPGNKFVQLLKTVDFAVDNKSSRYALGGVLVEFSKGTVSLVGTDGRRMCVAEFVVECATDDFVNEPQPGTHQKKAPIVPAKVVVALLTLADTDDRVQIDVTDRAITADVGGTVLQASLVEGRFPRWQDVEPRRDVVSSQVVVGELLATCRQAAICTSEQSKGVVFTFAREGLHLTSRSAEAGEASCTCDLVEAGHACTVSLDPAFVTEWLGCGSFDLQETIEIEAADAQSAVVLRAQDCRCVIMPLDPKG